MGEPAAAAEAPAAAEDGVGAPPCAELEDGGDTQVMQGDVVRSRMRGGEQLGWVCCITPESGEAHIYWQPRPGATTADSREPLKTLACADRALIPGDIVRRCDLNAGESHDRGGRERDAMGMVVGTEVLLDLQSLTDTRVFTGVDATSLRHLTPIRLATWVVHRSDGWLGRVHSWDEDLVLRFMRSSPQSESLASAGLLSTSAPTVSRCRIRAANLKPGLTIAESFYRDFFPGLTVNVNLQDLKSGTLQCEWLSGDVSRVSGDVRAEGSLGGPQKAEATIEEVSIGLVRVDWLAQVPLRSGLSSEQPPQAEGCSEDQLQFLLGEVECSSRWALGDRLHLEGTPVEVCKVETFVNVRWQDDVLSGRLPSRELQLCNPDAFSFFPSELVCQRILDESTGGVPTSRMSPRASSMAAFGGDAGGTPRSAQAAGDRGRSRDQQQPRLGFVTRADPASRMVHVRWLDEGCQSGEEEWSAFDLQIDPEFGYRLGDAVIRCCDWEEFASPVPYTAREGEGVGARVGQVCALEAGTVKVRWLDGTVSPHVPRDLYRVGDEEEGSVVDSQEAASEAPAMSVVTEEHNADTAAAEVIEAAAQEIGGQAAADVAAEPAASAAAGGGAPEASVQPQALGAPQLEPGDVVEVSFEDMAWEPLPTDHHFANGAPPSGPGRLLLRRVQREWEILQRGLPRGVLVHVYPDRTELLRACLVGPEGTPYADALFFFDLLLPPSYPQAPPQVRFWSFGENLNPNLYENGKVCLSLLGTWAGKDSEMWSPERSNLLQVLVSILGLVLNTEPYYNEPGFEREKDTPQGDLRSQRYNESVALSSYHLMLRVLRSPPADFDRISKRHFAERREAILAHARGLQLGGESVDVAGGSSGSEGFRKSLAALLPRLEELLPKELPP